ncbi:MAG: Flp pilus assembly complex ATPase component TadA [Candidatus Aegiribacteria sp.]|nr:Flp pilus assembly complex ATPase component TadA [Candidatus Aegiribacteria sp.]
MKQKRLPLDQTPSDYTEFIEYLKDSLNLDTEAISRINLLDRLSLYESAKDIGADEETFARYIAEYLQLEYFPYIDPESILTEVFTAPFSRSNFVLAIKDSDGETTYVLSNPFNLQLRDAIDMVAQGKAPRLGIAQPDSILALLKTYTPKEQEVKVVSSRIEDEDNPDNEKDAISELIKSGILEIEHEPHKDDINTSPIKYIADKIIYTAVEDKASDIHMEPKADKVVVRYRIDGDMVDRFTLKPRTGKTLLSRFKVMANIDIAERRKPQDGALEARIGGKFFKMRLATTSTPFGESLIIRLLDMDTKPMELAELGMTDTQAETMYEVSQQHSGAIIVVGTTGSGKSTTIYSLISNIDIKNRSLMTIEDPVEYDIAYANQQEVNEKAGVTFEALLKSAVRQDPDIIFLGEIRDPFTAKTVMDLTSTGHMTFGTLHSANTTTSIGRLERLGVSRADLADSVLLIAAQRLLKRLCPDCRKIRSIKPEEAEMLSHFTDNIPYIIADPVGCSKCKNKGYKGRQGIFEILKFNPEVIETVRSGESVSAMRQRFHDSGQYLMSDHAIDKLRDFSLCYNDIYHSILLEEKRLTGSIKKKNVAASTEFLTYFKDDVSIQPSESVSTVESQPREKHGVAVIKHLTGGRASTGARILIVDDDPDLREFISFILSSNGYDVTSTGDGIDAIVVLSMQKFDLIISDVDMPNLNGFKLLEIIINKGIETPVVFLTGRDKAEDEVKGYELGAEDYIRKPLHKETLLLRIRKILKR